MTTPLLITLQHIIRPGTKRARFGIIRGWRIGIVPFWDVDCACSCGGGGDTGCEGAVDEEFLVA
jgi:hypothetical protein